MKILFAAPDRDLLECYKKLLGYDYDEIVTAFDGTQVISLLSDENFDIVILDQSIPRIDYKIIIRQAQNRHIPVILLIGEPVSAEKLLEEPLPNLLLPYPFTSDAVKNAISDVVNKVSSKEKIIIGDTKINVSEFRIDSGRRLTSHEIDILESLINGEPASADEGVYIGALNDKFSQIGSKIRIKYRTKKGFEPVKENE